MAILSAIYVIVLGTIYAPAAIILASRGSAVAHAESGKSTYQDLRNWMKENGLAISISGQIARGAAILSPFIAGPLSTFVATLAKGSIL